jgi:hypothetical protein
MQSGTPAHAVPTLQTSRIRPFLFNQEDEARRDQIGGTVGQPIGKARAAHAPPLRDRLEPQPELTTVTSTSLPRVAAVQHGSLALDPPVRSYGICKVLAVLSKGEIPESFETRIKSSRLSGAEIMCN